MKRSLVLLPALLVAGAFLVDSRDVPFASPQAGAAQQAADRLPDVNFVPTPQEVVEKMLELAKVTKNDVVFDLGCGDGRIVVTAAKQFGCKARGYDIDPERVKESQENVKKNGVENLVEIKKQDIFTLDLSEASVVTLYLLPSLNVKLIPQLEKMKPGCRIVSNNFDMRGVEPDKVVPVQTKDGVTRNVYLWTTPLKKTPGEGETSIPRKPAEKAKPAEKVEKVEKPEQPVKTDKPDKAGKAEILVKLPTATARLTVGGQLTTQTGKERVFQTPPLQPGSSYSYDLVATWDKDGKPVTVKKTAELKIGQRTVVDFTSEASEKPKESKP